MLAHVCTWYLVNGDEGSLAIAGPVGRKFPPLFVVSYREQRSSEGLMRAKNGGGVALDSAQEDLLGE